MADDGFGLSFAPFSGRPGYGDNGGSSPLSPVQEAIQILSLRRPTVLGAQAPVNSALLGQPSGGPDLSALLQTLLKNFGQGQYHPPQFPKMTDPGSAMMSGSFPPMMPSAPSGPSGGGSLPNPSLGFQQPGKEPDSGSGSLMPSPPKPISSPYEPKPGKV